MAVAGLVHTALLVPVVAFAYHVETRYLFPLYPLFYVALAAALVGTLEWVLARVSSSRARVLRAACGVVVLVVATTGVARVVRMQYEVGLAGLAPGPCEDAVSFVREFVRADEPVLTSNPWYLTWRADKPTINAPTNGPAAFATVADHYGAIWAFVGPYYPAAADVGEMLRLVGHHGSSTLRPKLVFKGRGCDVYRLRRRPHEQS